MLPFCDRVVSVARKDVAPVWTRSFPIAKEPTTLGQHLKKRRFLAGIRQSEAALKLGVNKRTLSTWETDRVYPAWAFQPRLVAYLGYDPFNDPTLGRPKGNETSCVAFLRPRYKRAPERRCPHLDTKLSHRKGAHNPRPTPQEETIFGWHPAVGSCSKIGS